MNRPTVAIANRLDQGPIKRCYEFLDRTLDQSETMETRFFRVLLLYGVDIANMSMKRVETPLSTINHPLDYLLIRLITYSYSQAPT